MSALEAIAFWVLLAMFVVLMLRAFIWATTPRKQDNLMDHYRKMTGDE